MPIKASPWKRLFRVSGLGFGGLIRVQAREALSRAFRKEGSGLMVYSRGRLTRFEAAYFPRTLLSKLLPEFPQACVRNKHS